MTASGKTASPWTPRISLVTPSLNRGALIEKSILSARNQSLPAFEHVVMDGGSTDGTLDVVRRFPDIHLVSEPDRGVSDALNKAIRLTSGDVVGWLNTDDTYHPRCLELVSDYFREHPETDVLYCDYRLVRPDGGVIQNRRELGYDYFMLFFLHTHYMPSCTTFFRRSIFEDGEWFDLSYRYAMDYDLNLRLALKGYRFAHLPRVLADFTVHPNSISTAHKVEQTAEFERAQAAHNPLYRSLPEGLRGPARAVLRRAARGKRLMLKFCAGHYFRQFPGGVPHRSSMA